MITQLGYIQFRTHRVMISRDSDSDHILCFKSTIDNSRCDWDSFNSEGAAADYIIEPMPEGVWEFREG